jgi:hypothetical protein
MNNLMPSTAPQNGWTDEACRKWWFRMGEIFGKPWFEKNGPEPSQLWQQSLKRMPMEKAAAVLEHYRKAGQTFPPNMSEVVELSGLLRRWEEPQKALPKPRSQDVATRHLESMKDILKRCEGMFALRKPGKTKPFNDDEFEAAQMEKGR